MNEWLQFWGSIAGLLGLVVAIMSLVRDTFDFQLKWSTSSSYVKRIIVNRRFLFSLVALLLGFSFWSLFSQIQNLEKINEENNREITNAYATQTAQARNLEVKGTEVLIAHATQAAQATRFAELQATLTVEVSSVKVPIAIDSRKGWQPTGIVVSEGEEVHIKVVGGEWAVYRRELSYEEKSGLSDKLRNYPAWLYTWDENSGNGYKGNFCESNCPVKNFNVGGLIGKIGETEPFPVGQEKWIPVKDSGELYLRINDDDSDGLADNHGILAVEISLKKG